MHKMSSTGCCKKKKIPLQMFLQNGNDKQITQQITLFFDIINIIRNKHTKY